MSTDIFKPEHFDQTGDETVFTKNGTEIIARIANELLPQLLDKRYFIPERTMPGCGRFGGETHYILCTKPIAIEPEKVEFVIDEAKGFDGIKIPGSLFGKKVKVTVEEIK